MDPIERTKKEILRELSLRRKWVGFFIWSSALLGFLLSRLFATFFPDVHLILFGFHIHHFYYGILLVLLAGALALTYRGFLFLRLSCFLYGFGLGILLDEIGLLLTWGDYWAGVTYDIFIFFTVLAMSLIFLPDVLRRN